MSKRSSEKHAQSMAQTIRPLRVDLGKKNTGASDENRRRSVKTLLAPLVVLVLLGSGGWFLKDLSSRLPDREKTGGLNSPPHPPQGEVSAVTPDLRPPEPQDPERHGAEKPTVEPKNNLATVQSDHETPRPEPRSEKKRSAPEQGVHPSIKDQEFERLMSNGLNAFHQNRHEAARTLLLGAKTLKPEAPDVIDALKQVDGAIQLAAIERLHRDALNAEKMEKWEQALTAYLEVIQMDAAIQFAAIGKQRAIRQIRIAKRMDFFLEKPGVLTSDEQLANAIHLMGEVAELSPKGPSLAAKEEKLSGLVRAAQTPVEVTLESDNLTQVAVYRVVKPGRFLSKTLNLRPGAYVVVGARDGYQDVRQNLVIKPHQGPTRIRIVCTVKL